MTVRFTVVLDGREYPVEVTEDLEVRIQDRRYRPAVEVNDGSYRVAVGASRFEFRLEGRRLLHNGSPLRATFQGYLQPSHVQEALMEGAPSGGEVRAPMPGRVVAVAVRKGDVVTPGTPLLVLEAMKMQNEIPASVEGRVQEVRVRPGATVGRDEVLVVLG